MTRLNTDNLAALFSADTLAAEPKTTRSESPAQPFDDFLRRAGGPPDTKAKDSPLESDNQPRPSEDADPINERSHSNEPDNEPRENREASESTSGADQEPADDADSATEDTQSRGPRKGSKSGQEDARNESTTARAAKPTDTSGLAEPPSQTPLQAETPREEQPDDLRRQGDEQEPVKVSQDTPEPGQLGDKGVTESQAKSGEAPSSKSSVDNPLASAASPEGRQASSQEPRRRTARQGPTRSADRSSQTVAKTPAGQNMATGAEQVNPEAIAAVTKETKSETQDEALKPTSAAEVKVGSPNPPNLPKGWSPEGLRSTAAPSTSDGTQTDQVDRVRFVQRVARAFEALGEGDGSVRLRLKPPELGGLRLEVTVRNGVMTAHIETETSAARTLLLDNLPALRERLAQQDIKVDSFDVDLADRSGDDSPQRPDDDRQPRDRTNGEEAQTPENQESEGADLESVRPVARRGEAARLDVVI